MDQNHNDNGGQFTFGWEEWVALPVLGLPALKAKVDSGARTSALHAFEIEPFGPADKPLVRFSVHPIAGRDDVVISCSAPLLEQRDVTSSNGETENRYVIETLLEVGGRSWPIEVTLTDRRTMNSRMLLGRQALGPEITVQPSQRFYQPELDHSIYLKRQRRPVPKRSLRIAVLSREDNYSTRRLVEEGSSRDHVVEVIDTRRCYMAINQNAPAVYYDDHPLPRFDAVIPRIGASITSYGTAVVRQFETIGTYCVNSSDGIGTSRDKLAAHQVLARNRIGMPATAFASSPGDTSNLMKLVGGAPLIVKLLESTQGKGVVLAETRKAAESVISAFRNLQANFLVQQFVKEANGEDIRCMVIGGRVVGAIKRKAAEGEFRSNLHQGGAASKVRITKQERETAIRAAKALQLNFAGVDLLRGEDGPKVLEVNSSPGLEGIEKATGLNIAAELFEEIEKRVQMRAPLRARNAPRSRSKT